MSTTSPEAAVVEEDAPKYSPEDLRDPNKLDEALDDYEISDIEVMSSSEIDAKLEQGLRDGLFRREAGEDMKMDNTFGGVEVVATTPDVPDVETLLDAMRTRKLEALRDEKTHEISTEVTAITDPSQKAEHMAFMAEEAYRSGGLALVETKAAEPGKPFRKGTNGRPDQQAVPGKPAEYGLWATDRKQQAVLQAFQSEVSKLDPQEQTKFRESITKIGQRKVEIDKDEADKKARAKTWSERDKKDRADEARRKIESATNAKAADAKRMADDTAKNEQIADLGLQRETIRKGTKIDNPDPRAKELTRSGVAKKDYEVTSSAVHEEALKMNEQVDLQRQVGAKEYARIQEFKEKAPQALEAYKLAHDQWEAAQKTGQLGGPPEPKLDDYDRYGPNGGMRVQNKDIAHEQALDMDPGVRAQNEIHRFYQDKIDAQTDINMKRIMTEARNRAVEDERARQTELTKAHADTVIMAMDAVTKMTQKSAAGEADKFSVRDADQAHEIRTMLNADPFPSLEVKVGGMLGKNKGPKMLESWFRVPGNDQLWLVERYNRRTGEMISQTMVSSADGSERTRKGKPRPPRSAVEQFAEVRADDVKEMAKKPGANPDGSKGMLKGVKDKVRLGFGIGGHIEGAEGVYGQYAQDQYFRLPNNQPPIPNQPNANPNIQRTPAGARMYAENAEVMHKKQGNRERRGGILYQLINMGKRVPKSKANEETASNGG